MIKPLKSEEIKASDEDDEACELWATQFANDFRTRFSNLLGFDF